MQAHKPEVCYPAQGFVVQKSEAALLATALGNIPVRRLFTNMGARQEPMTYWYTVGYKVVQGTMQKRLVDLRYGLTGHIPDGMLSASLQSNPMTPVRTICRMNSSTNCFKLYPSRTQALERTRR